MNIVLFAIIGATIKAGTWYWLCFGFYSLFWFFGIIDKITGERGD